MKKILTLLLITLVFYGVTNAQSPQAVPFQAVARDSNGIIIPNQAMSLRLTIHEDSASGATDYQETQSVTTNNLGLFTLSIGQGTVISGTFGSISWAAGAKFIQVELDPTGGTSYTSMGTTQLNSVPYALFAANSASVAQPAGQVTYGTGASITSDANFTRNDTNQYTNIFSHGSPGILEGISIGGPQVMGHVAEGTYIQRFDSAEDHQDLIGVGAFDSSGRQLGLAMVCLRTSGPVASIALVDSDPVNTIVEIDSKNASLTNYQGEAYFKPDSVSLGLYYGGSSLQYGISIDTNTLSIINNSKAWTWPTSDGSTGQVLSTNGSGVLGWASASGGASQPAGQVIYGTGIGVSSDANFTRNDSDQHTNILSHSVPGILEGISIGGSQLGLFPDGTFIERYDSTENHVDLIGTGDFSNLNVGSSHGIGVVCAKNLLSGGPVGIILIADSDPVYTPIEMISSSTATTNYEADAFLYPYHTFMGISKSNVWQNLIEMDTNTVHIVANSHTWDWPTSDGTSGQALTTNGGGTLGWSSIQFPHTVFTPGSGDTVNLNDNHYNIINPGGSISSLTVVLPASPSDNDVVEIKFTQPVSSITYLIPDGSVVDQIYSASVGTYIKLVYDSTDSYWY